MGGLSFDVGGGTEGFRVEEDDFSEIGGFEGVGVDGHLRERSEECDE